MMMRSRRRGQGPGADDAAVVAQLAREHLDDVYRYALYLVADRAAAEDVAAAAFERALRSLDRFDPRRGSARTWLCQLARGAALDHLRAEQRRRRRESRFAAQAGAEPVEASFGDGLSPELEAALRRLSAGEREVVALRLLLDLDGATCARLLGISETACSTRLSRALGKLKQEIGTGALA
jgi:RNA polymerase sigma-70 factor (ECF subfamily)